MSTQSIPEPITRAYAAKIDVSDGERAVVARINTDTVDRYRTVIDPAGIDLTAYRTNPVVLWEHGQDVRGRVPVARSAWVKLDKADRSIVAKSIFADDEFSDGIFRLYQADVLRGFSINGLPKEYSSPTPDEVKKRPELADASTIYRATELTEYSAVSVPGNAEALTLAVSRGLWLPESLKRSAGEVMDENDATPPKEEAKKRSNGKPYVVHETDIGKWCVYGPGDEKLAEFDTESEADDFVEQEAKDREREAEAEKHARRVRSLTRMIKKEDGKFFVYSADGKKKLGGPYDSKGEAEKRLREVEEFKKEDVKDADRALELPPLVGTTYADVLQRTILGIRAETALIREEEAARRDLRRGIV